MANAADRPAWVRRALLAGGAYVLISIATVAADGMHLGAPRRVRGASWILGFVVFLLHIVRERRSPASRRDAAAHAATGVALGAFVVALIGPVRGHWNDPQFSKIVLLSVVLWPLAAGIPAYVVALILGVLTTKSSSTASTPAA